MFQKLMNSPKQLRLMVLLLCLAGSFSQVMLKKQSKPVFDAVAYISIAQDLTRTGIFTNAKKQQNTEPGSFTAPLYPGFLSLFPRFSPQISEAFDCYRTDLDTCNFKALTPIFVIQSLIAGVTLFFVYLASLALMNRQDVAIITVFIAGASSVFSHYAGILLTENLAFFFFMGFFAFYAKAMFRSPSIKNWVIAVAMLAFSILTRPTYIYFFYLLIPFSLLWCRFKFQKSWRFGGAVALSVMATGVVVLLPWMLRNYAHFGELYLTNGYAAYILVQRLAYNLMSWGEWGAGFIFLLPDFGDSLARDLFDRSLYVRYTWHDPTSFYSIGNGSFRGEMTGLAGGTEHLLGYLIKDVIIPNFGKHIMVTFVVLLRGMWIGKYIGLLAVLCLPYIMVLAKQNGQLLNFLSFLLPGMFFLGFHAFVSINISRYNEPLIAVYAFIVAIFLIQIAAKISPAKVRAVTADWP